MAFMSQENKKQLAPKIKEILKKYNLKGSISVGNRSALQLNITSGPFSSPDCRSVNHYHLNSETHGEWYPALVELRDAMMIGNHDRSDMMSDYFDVGWYVKISVGQWDKPYVRAA